MQAQYRINFIWQMDGIERAALGEIISVELAKNYTNIRLEDGRIIVLLNNEFKCIEEFNTGKMFYTINDFLIHFLK